MRNVVALALVLLVGAAPAQASTYERLSSRYFFGMGFVVRKAPSELGNLAGLNRSPYVARTTETPPALFDHDAGLRWRAGLGLGSGLYVAVDTGLGVIALPDGPQMSAPQRTGSSATMAAVAGLRGTVESLTLGIELAGGFRHVTYCIGESIESHDAYSGFQEVAEVRVRGERRLGRQVQLGVTLGTSLIDRGAWVGALDLTIHIAPRI